MELLVGFFPLPINKRHTPLAWEAAPGKFGRALFRGKIMPFCFSEGRDSAPFPPPPPPESESSRLTARGFSRPAPRRSAARAFSPRPLLAAPSLGGLVQSRAVLSVPLSRLSQPAGGAAGSGPTCRLRRELWWGRGRKRKRSRRRAALKGAKRALCLGPTADAAASERERESAKGKSDCFSPSGLSFPSLTN